MDHEQLVHNYDHSISLSDATAMTAAWRSAHPTMEIANAFGKDAMLAILNQEGCVGIRFYNALNSDNTQKLVAVGVGSDEKDMYTGILAQRSLCCACWYGCVTNSPLSH